MVLEKKHDRIARWNHSENCWSVEDRPVYRWCNIQGRAITDWYSDFKLALDFAVNKNSEEK